MSFWSDKKLRANYQNIFFPPDAGRIDVSGYRLSIGSEAYVTSDNDRSRSLVIDVSAVKSFSIPSGQYALILTREIVKIPKDAIGLISIRSMQKFKGLVNVSGFHVDPGYDGRLVFGVLNAGPTSILLHEGDDIFMIWLASLNEENGNIYDKPIRDKIPPRMVNELYEKGPVSSLPVLGDKVERIETFRKYLVGIAGSIGALLISAAVYFLLEIIDLKVRLEVMEAGRQEEVEATLALQGVSNNQPANVVGPVEAQELNNLDDVEANPQGL